MEIANNRGLISRIVFTTIMKDVWKINSHLDIYRVVWLIHDGVDDKLSEIKQNDDYIKR